MWLIFIFMLMSKTEIPPVAQQGFQGGSVVKNPPANSRRHMFNPLVRKIPWRRKWQPTLVFLPGEPHGQKWLVGDSP